MECTLDSAGTTHNDWQATTDCVQRVVLRSTGEFILVPLPNPEKIHEIDPSLFQFLLIGPKKMTDDNPIEWLPNVLWYTATALADVPGHYVNMSIS